VGTADSARGRLGHAEVRDFAFFDQVLDRSGYILDRHIRVDSVLVVQIDGIDA
jgi:hypothetical protein